MKNKLVSRQFFGISVLEVQHQNTLDYNYSHLSQVTFNLTFMENYATRQSRVKLIRM